MFIFVIPDRVYKNKNDLSDTFGKTYHKLVTDIIDKSMNKLGTPSKHWPKPPGPEPYVDPTLTISVE
jgi:hypothetical protein